jgi:exodeoxyribonuclease V alpha subunit
MEKVSIEGVVEKVTYYNKDSGYAVFTVSDDKAMDSEHICVGTIPEPAAGENVSITGILVNHPVYGIQIKIETYTKSEPKGAKAIERYLSSGVIKGIGKRMAAKIVKKFGDDTLRIMDSEPERLAEIKGISNERAVIISKQFSEQAGLRNALLFLGEYGVTPSYGMRIYKQYKDRTIDVVKKNPYALADDVFGIGFNIADEIAEKVGIDSASPFRIRAGVKYALNTASLNGHVYLPIENLVRYTAELLHLEGEIIEHQLISMHIENYIWIEGTGTDRRVYLNFFNKCEKYVARKLNELSDSNLKKKNYASDIDKLEREESITFAPQQKIAIQSAMEHGVLVITGGPGTGKTTIINSIIKLSEDEGYEILLAAPTGRAAKRMEEATGHTAQTIHRLLGVKFLEGNGRQQSFDHDEDNPLEADLIIIDESSMIDIMLMHALLKAVPEGTRLILVGDADQLPSVGAGNVLKDIINSGEICVVKLTEIFRQAQESMIVTNSHRINNGVYPVLDRNDGDFFFMKRNNAQAIQALIVDLISRRLPNYLKCNPVKDIQVLTPMRKSPLGVQAINELLQQALNPPSENKNQKEVGSTIFREGDKVMQIKNDYDIEWKSVRNGKIVDEGIGIYNGDEGVINFISDEESFVEVVFDDDKIVHYDFSQLDKLELSYAVTIHKSQGSEYKAVVMPLLNGPDMLMSRNLLYTGLTRAKELAVIIGLPDVVNRMVDNNREVNRYTTLTDKINEYAKI